MGDSCGRTRLSFPFDGGRLIDDLPQSKLRSVLVIDPISSGTLFEPVLEGLGLRTILLDTPQALAAGHRLSPSPNALDFDGDFSGDLRRLRDFCLRHDVGYVVAGAESGIELCEQLRGLLPGCPHNAPEKPSRRWDKFDMISALADAGVPHLHTTQVFDMDDFDRAFNGFADQSKWVVKPARGAGSVDVELVDSLAAARTAVARLLDRPGLFGDRVGALVQQHYRGDEYVVDTFSHAGTHDVISVCAYQKALRAGAFVYERTLWIALDHENVSSLVDYSYRVLDALGVKNGSSHLEILLGSAGPRLVDFGARPDGGSTQEIAFHLTGNSQVHAESAYVKSVCDSTTSASYSGSGGYFLNRRGAIVDFNIERPGTFVAADPELELRRVDGVVDATINARYGCRYPTTRSLEDSLQLGFAFLVADTAAELDRICSCVERTVKSWFSYN
jgi:hypothetical protein